MGLRINNAIAQRNQAERQRLNLASKERASKRKQTIEETAAMVQREQVRVDNLNEHPPRGIKTALGVSKFAKVQVVAVGSWKKGVK